MSYEQLWAPWRLSYIVTTKNKEQPHSQDMPNCFLCRYREDEQADPEHYVLSRTSNSMTLLNRFPYNNGHLLIAPLKHKSSLDELDDDELLECMHQLQRMTAALTKLIQPDGFNIGLNLGAAAGAGLPGHLHWHVVPRWNGDTNFMTVLAEVNVIPQSLEALYQLMRAELEADLPS